MVDPEQLRPPETRGHYSVANVPAAWYVACRSHELGEAPMTQTILGVPLVLYRDAGERAAALLDRCPHRNVRLSLGQVDPEGHLACGYHGWRFDGKGRCVDVPGMLSTDEAAARGRSVPAYAVREQDGFIWVWGQPDTDPRGEPVRIPFVEDPDYLVVHREYLFESTLHAALENALDVPHTAFVHKGDFRGQGERQSIEAVRRRIPDGIEVEYEGEKPLMGDHHDEEGRVIVQKHWDRFFMPSVAQVEYKTGDQRHLITTLPHTPISDFQTRAWLVSCWKVPGLDESGREGVEAYLDQILAQDVEVLREQTESLRRFGGEAYRSTELDLMGPAIWHMLKQSERGLDPNASDISRRIQLSV